MRLPIVTRRHAEFTKGLVRIQLQWEKDDHDETRDVLAETQQRLSAVLTELRREQARCDRLKAYMARMHGVRYEQRIGRLRRAVASERAMGEAYRKTITRLTDQLLDATGYQGEPLLPAARTTLGIDKEVDA